MAELAEVEVEWASDCPKDTAELFEVTPNEPKHENAGRVRRPPAKRRR